jgi:intein/homing endonuclease
MRMSDKILSEKFLSKYKNKQPKWGFNGLGYIVYKRTYARTKPDGTTEEWWETLERCIEGAQKIGAKYTVEEAEELYDAMFNLECSFSGRSLWQLGTALVDEGYMDSLLNCFAGETLVLTRQGWKRIDSLSGASHEIVTENGKWVKSHFKCFGQQRLKKITLKEQYGKNNQTIYATDNHEWLVITNKGRIRKTTKELQNGDQLPIILGKNSSQYLSPQGIQHGLVYGDGSCNEYESTVDLIDNTYLYCNKYFSNNRSNIIKDNHVRYGGLPNYYKSLPNINENKPYLMGFLAGWIAADGNVNSTTGTIRLFNKDKNVLLMAKDIASVCGFRTTEPYFESDINPFNGEKRTLWSISFYLCDKSEILIIRDDHKYNLKINTKKRHCDYVKVINIEDTNRTENVYCCVVPDTHSFVIQGNILTGNCWGSKVSTIDDFYFIVLESMMGGGVGNNISREYTQELPRVKENVKCICKKTNDADFIVPDSKEGWCELFKRVLQAYLETGRSFSWSPICIRKEGEPLKRFGGIAPGDKPLIEGISLLCGVLNNRQGKKLRTQDVADIICIGGEIMKSGGIRRTALILGGDVDDTAYLLLKRWDLCNIPYYRSNSNNSLLTSKFEYLSSKFWDGFSGNGEAYGLLNLFLARKYGRIGETEFDGFSLFDPNVIIFNPCITDDTWILTTLGPKQVKDLLNQKFDIKINNELYSSYSEGFFFTGNKEVYEIETSKGYKLICTPDHLIQTTKGWTKAKDLSIYTDRKIILNNNVNNTWLGKGNREEGWLLGNLLGDGYISKNRSHLCYWGNNKEKLLSQATMKIRKYLFGRKDIGSGKTDKSGRLSLSSKELHKLAIEYGLNDKNISTTIEKSSSDFYCGFLSGWFDADGSIQGNHNKGISIRLSSVNLKNLEAAQRMLSRLGIISTIYKNRRERGKRFLPDSNRNYKLYNCQTNHELVISRDQIKLFADIIGFEDIDKNIKLNNSIENYKRELYKTEYSDDFKSITYIGTKPVYDVNIQNIHCFDANGIIIHNCAEATLCDKEPCNLAEHMINIVPSKEKMLRNAILLYKTQKAICHGEYLFEDTNKIVHKNYKIGQSITGICQRLDVIEDWADYVYRGLRKFDKEWSKKNNIPQSKRLTVIQPSGTKSLLSGSMPGGHPGYSKYHIRRVRFSSNDKLIPLLRKCNYPIEPEIRIDGSTNHNMLVVSFPCKFDGGIFAEEFGAIAQMDLVKKLQTCWADQSVSVTIYYKEEELEDIKKWLADNYDSSVKSMSFLRHSNHNFPQAPYEQIDEKTYMNIVSKLKNIDQFNINNGDILSDISCVGGHCPVR